MLPGLIAHRSPDETGEADDGASHLPCRGQPLRPCRDTTATACAGRHGWASRDRRINHCALRGLSNARDVARDLRYRRENGQRHVTDILGGSSSTATLPECGRASRNEYLDARGKRARVTSSISTPT